jgi:transposase
LVGKYPFQLKIISYLTGVNYGKFYHWYKDSLSGFRTVKIETLPIQLGDKSSEILIPILRADQVGSHMAIDEKHIDGKYYTVLTNATTGMVAMLASTVVPHQIGECIAKLGVSMGNVAILSRDLAPTFENVGNLFFPHSMQVADKYHVVKHALDCLQDIRVRLKQQALSQQKQQQAIHKNNKKKNNKKCGVPPSGVPPSGVPPSGVPPTDKQAKFVTPKIENGETMVELLTRSKYLLNIKATNWNQYQIDRSNLLFKYFPELKTAHEIINKFRDWYEPIQKSESDFYLENQLLNWQFEAEQSKIKEVIHFQNLVKLNEEYILNYHKGLATNAIAESVNAKIQNAIRQNKGTRDIDFFHFRLAKIL